MLIIVRLPQHANHRSEEPRNVDSPRAVHELPVGENAGRPVSGKSVAFGSGDLLGSHPLFGRGYALFRLPPRHASQLGDDRARTLFQDSGESPHPCFPTFSAKPDPIFNLYCDLRRLWPDRQWTQSTHDLSEPDMARVAATSTGCAFASSDETGTSPPNAPGRCRRHNGRFGHLRTIECYYFTSFKSSDLSKKEIGALRVVVRHLITHCFTAALGLKSRSRAVRTTRMSTYCVPATESVDRFIRCEYRFGRLLYF
jgi:hypothetical protein